MTIALHACCGPCLIEPLESLRAEDDVVIVYANPNIDSEAEYELRRDTLLGYAAAAGAAVVEIEYDHAAWRDAVAGREQDPPARCAACYELRLGMTARWAATHGIESLATTLTVSPYQDAESIRKAGERAAEASRIAYVHRDFRNRYSQAIARARELGLYRQNYCGCEYSKREADEARARRRARRETAGAERRVHASGEKVVGDQDLRPSGPDNHG